MSLPYKAFPDNVSDFFEKGWFLTTPSALRGETRIPVTSCLPLQITRTDSSPIPRWTSIRSACGKPDDRKEPENRGIPELCHHRQVGVPQAGRVTATNVFYQLWYMPRSYDLFRIPYIDPVTHESIHYRAGQDNPYYIAQENKYTSDVNRMLGYVDAGLEITDWLTATYKFGFNNYTDHRMQFYAKSTQYNDGWGPLSRTTSVSGTGV